MYSEMGNSSDGASRKTANCGYACPSRNFRILLLQYMYVMLLMLLGTSLKINILSVCLSGTNAPPAIQIQSQYHHTLHIHYTYTTIKYQHFDLWPRTVFFQVTIRQFVVGCLTRFK